MKIWSVSFILLFGSIEFYQWLKAMQIPLPVYMGLGILLAIASNLSQAERSTRFKFSAPASSSPADREPSPQIIPKPPIPALSPSKSSISFKINASEKMRDETPPNPNP